MNMGLTQSVDYEKKYTDIINFQKTIVDHWLVMIKDFDKVSNLRKMYSIFILWTIIFMSHHMTMNKV